MTPRLGFENRVNRSFTTAVGAAVLVCASGGEALGHGGIPRAHSVQLAPDNSEQLLVRSNIWGSFRSSDGGQSWSWSCAEMYGGDSLTYEWRSIALLPSGEQLTAAAFDGLVRTSADGCSFETIAVFDEYIVNDVVRRNSDGALFVATSRNTGTLESHLWISDDEGLSWDEPAEPIETNFITRSVGISETDANRIYVAGTYAATDSTEGARALLRSTDGGASWESLPFTEQSADSNGSLLVTAVHPDNPDWIWIRYDAAEGAGENVPDSLYFSSDGGNTWETVLEGSGDLPGFALSPDGLSFAIGGPLDGLVIGEVDGSGGHSTANDGKVWGLSWTAQGLYAGTDNFTPSDQRFTMGVSQDQGESFSERLSLCELNTLSCPTDSPYVKRCIPQYYEIPGNFVEDFVRGGACQDTGDAGASGGAGNGGSGGASVAGGAPGAADGGPPTAPQESVEIVNEGCSVSPSRTGLGGASGETWAMLGLGLGLGLWRRRSGKAEI